MSRLSRVVGVSWVYLSTFANIGVGLILLPFVLHHLTSVDVGMWFVFGTIIAGTQLIETGFQSTFTRNIAYIYEGTQYLTGSGVPKGGESKRINYNLLTTAIRSVRLIYLIFASLDALLLFLIGYFFIPTLIKTPESHTYYLLNWMLFAIAGVINISNGWIVGLLYGKGDYRKVSKINIVSKLTLLISSVIGLKLNYGLEALGLSAIIGALIAKLLLFKNIDPIESSIKIHFRRLKEEINLLRLLLKNALRTTAVQIGGFLVQRASIIIAANFMGASESAPYSLTVTLLMTLSAVSMSICQLQLPRIARMQLQPNNYSLATRYGEMIFVSFAIYVAGAIFLLSFGRSLIGFVGSDVQLIEPRYFIILTLIYFLELNHSLAGSYLTTLNKVPFLPAAMISGILIVTGTLLLISEFGILALVASQGIVQLMYNNWKWPTEVSKHLQYSNLELLRIGYKSLGRKFF